ncbi:hypothetical protein HP1_130 [Candidatus Termititenax spirochaetophilus]|uniref:Uncharacterized protein n=1 Tax=Candidatus Termititenax spirochaetophilus TaxID=2218522 RepID=A0A388T9X6_9BACT|nr:hypothetical protein HP1_130 [Candidatus Termititenax spirochaetophilus]
MQNRQWAIKLLESLKRKNKDDLASESLYNDAIAEAKEMQTLARGKEFLPRTLIEHMLDAIIGARSNSKKLQLQELQMLTEMRLAKMSIKSFLPTLSLSMSENDSIVPG